jgi:hypothetical protein
MTKRQSTSSDNPRQPGIKTPVHAIRPDPDNADPWAAGYAAGLRASGSTFIADDNIDPRVVVVRMLPDEYLEEAIAKSELIEFKERVVELGHRLARLVSDYPPRPRLH